MSENFSKRPGDPTIICMTPVKNEEWILERFLHCASTWADHIVVADQLSEDHSREIAARFPKVHLIDNPSETFNEPERQKLLINAARAIPCDGRRLLVALDADEVFSATWMTSTAWQAMLAADPGTAFRFQWINLAPGARRGWLDPSWRPFAFMDDGSPHVGLPIHSPRIPLPEGAPQVRVGDVNVLHYPYTNWPRMKSKQRWYQCFERLEYPEKRAVQIYRQYHYMDTEVERSAPLDPAHLRGYEERGIDMTTIDPVDRYYWDDKVLEMLSEHGPDTFRQIDIWDVDWGRMGRSAGLAVNVEFDDPRRPLDRAIHRWLARTQPSYDRPLVRVTAKLLQTLGW
jgi:hypothetical protein